MEAPGLAIGIAGLAGLFSSCLEVIEKVDSYRDFGRDSRSLAAQFHADKLRFENWGRDVGVKRGKLSDNHHHALDDPQTSSMVKELLSIIQETICSGADDAFPQRPLLVDAEFAGDDLFPPSRARPYRGAPSESKRRKIAWTLRGKGRRTAQVEQFGVLVQHLHNLVPPDGAKGARPVQGAFATSNSGPGRLQDDLIDKGAWTAELRQILIALEEEIEAETRRDLHAWLGSHYSNDLYNDSIQKKLDGTCNWILDRPAFLDWLSPDISVGTPKLLWVNGPAGFGKTILCARVVEHLSSMLETPIAHFFLSSNFESRHDPYSAIRSWIAQVISRDRAAFDLVRERWLAQHEQVATRTNVVTLFREIIQAVPRCTFVLDGLDECTWMGESRTGNESVAGFLEATRRAVADTTTRIMIVRRDEPEIRRAVSYARGFSEIRISSQDVRSDVVLYSRNIVDRKLLKKDEVTKSDISLKLADRCNGQFLWVKMQEDSLRSWKNKKQLEDAIDKTPPGLEHLYERNWMRMSRLPDRERTRAYSLLRWAAFSLRPLTVCEITEAVLIDDGCDDLPVEEMPDLVDEDYIDSEILGPCGSLLEVRSTPSEPCAGLETVHLTHFSVKQYFLCHISDQGGLLIANQSLRYSNEALESTTLARLCLRYVNYRRVWEGALQEERGRVEKSFRDYAAGSWYQHATASGADDATLVELMNALFDAHNPNWGSWRKWFDLNDKESQIKESTSEVTAGPLYYASQLGLIGVVRHHIQDRKHSMDEKTHTGRTALGIACAKGNVEVVEMLLEARADITIANSNGWTPLGLASANGHVEVVKLLFDRGADVTVANNDGWTPMHAALLKGHVEVVKLLLDWGA
ncbi:hypothetical protein B0T10DRAFT_551286, partial [Thelonectria olida]